MALPIVKYNQRYIFFAKDVKAAEILLQISEVYGGNIMSDGFIRKWFRTFKVGNTNIHYGGSRMQSLVVTEDFVQNVEERGK
ncbi:hypothetical protein CEXT_690641 [Caerostris extrusa]|uniref:Mos1 transposase HTH domain-containing protein n=1 Tax=Caerostris extrusa TaxID=172846 RepID=A0AAV4SVG3_CAEEX|nr:hypothetical protein CEXT_690641 [Caerostris extrusa]